MDLPVTNEPLPSARLVRAQVLVRPDGRTGAIGHADPAEDVTEMDLDRSFGDAQGPTDLLVGQTLCHQPQHLELTHAERVADPWRGRGQERPRHSRVQG